MSRDLSLYAISWGWNSEGRAGNLTEDVISSPKQVQRSIDINFIEASAGKHHSLLLSSKGNVYSFGDNKKGQLGYGNMFTTKTMKKLKFKPIPKQITPSGEYIFKKDLKISKIYCGSSFSIAKEISLPEGLELVEGFLVFENSLKKLLKEYPDSESIQIAWSYLRHERFTISASSKGRVLVWGSGRKGQLGLGQNEILSTFPRQVWKLRKFNIVKLAVGLNHVLAIDTNGLLFTWGSGKSGQLGHGDFEDRFSPEVVKFFLSLKVRDCSAGDLHSAVIISQIESFNPNEIFRIASFGRGSHGRLGTGSNRSSPSPLLVSHFPPSIKGANFKAISCGGAHTLALAYIPMKKGLANPYGYQTFVLSWGFGQNGQLGNGYTFDSFKPIRCRLPKYEIISQISAGRSWSIAKTISGEVFTWGKGLRGELGQLGNKFSLAPRKLDCFASVLKISSGYHHNVGIAIPKKFLNPQIVERLARNSPDFEAFKVDQVAKLEPLESRSIHEFICCKRIVTRHTPSYYEQDRYFCLSCGMDSICITCAKVCHFHHELVLVHSMRKPDLNLPDSRPSFKKPKQLQIKDTLPKLPHLYLLPFLQNRKKIRIQPPPKVKVVSGKKKEKKKQPLFNESEKDEFIPWSSSLISYTQDFESQRASTQSAYLTHKGQFQAKPKACFCSLLHPTKCRILPSVQEASEVKGQSSPSLLAKQDFHRSLEMEVSVLSRNHFARKIQRAVKQYIDLHRKRIEAIEHIITRREVCRDYVKNSIMTPIWNKLQRSYELFREKTELKEMRMEEATTSSFFYRNNLQNALIGIQAMIHGIREYLGVHSVLLPRVSNREVTDIVKPTYSFTWESVRFKQMKLHHNSRVDPRYLAILTKGVPRRSGFLYKEGRTNDLDVDMYFRSCVMDRNYQLWEDHLRIKEREAQRLKKEKREKELEKLIDEKFSAELLKIQAEAITNNQQDMSVEKENQVKDKIRNILKLRDPDLNYKDDNVDETTRIKQMEDYEFDIQSPLPYKVRLDRRKSINDPTFLYQRVLASADKLSLKAAMHRRNSLPDDIHELVMPSMPDQEHRTIGISNSLEFFFDKEEELLFMNEYLEKNDEEEVMLDLEKEGGDSLDEEVVQKKVNERRKLKITRIKNLLQKGLLNPRLPHEINDLLIHRQRRRSVAEPERLPRQLNKMMDIREHFVNTLDIFKEEFKIKRKRRSFDHGEFKDAVQGVDSILEFEFEEPMQVVTNTSLKRDSMFMELNMGKVGFISLSPERKKIIKMKLEDFDASNSFSSAKYSASNKGEAKNADLSQITLNQGVGLNQQSEIGPRGSSKVKFSDKNIVHDIGNSYHNLQGAQNTTGPTLLTNKLTPNDSQAHAAINYWQVYYTDEDGTPYYYNKVTGETTWDNPQAAAGETTHQLEYLQQDEYGNSYWQNMTTGETYWA